MQDLLVAAMIEQATCSISYFRLKFLLYEIHLSVDYVTETEKLLMDQRHDTHLFVDVIRATKVWSIGSQT